MVDVFDDESIIAQRGERHALDSNGPSRGPDSEQWAGVGPGQDPTIRVMRSVHDERLTRQTQIGKGAEQRASAPLDRGTTQFPIVRSGVARPRVEREHRGHRDRVVSIPRCVRRVVHNLGLCTPIHGRDCSMHAG